MDKDQYTLQPEAEVEEGEPEYAFDGYKVELNERVALTPPSVTGPAQGTGRG